MKKSFFLFTCLLFLAPASLLAQMAGTYTVGDLSKDYRNIEHATRELKDKGMSGHVTLLLKSGTYPSFQIDSIHALFGTYRLTLQPEFDTSKVLVRGYGSVISLYRASNVTVKNLSIEALSATAKCAYIESSKNCELIGCTLSSPNGEKWGNASEKYVALYVRNGFNRLDSSSLLVRGCTFTGTGNSVYTSGPAGVLRIVSTDFGQTGLVNFGSEFPGRIFIDSCLLYTEVQMDWTFKGSFTANTVYGTGELSFNSVIGNQFLDTDAMEINALTVKDNLFAGDTEFESVKWIEGNEFLKKMEVNRTNETTMLNNLMWMEARLSRVENAVVEGNEFKGELRGSFCYNMLFINNLVHGKANFGISDRSKIIHNNFANDAGLNTSFGEVYANNFGGQTYVGSSSFVSHNNYYPSYGTDDNYPFHVDPMYDSNGALKAQNPTLMGQAPAVPDVVFDFDKVRRAGPATIGAHEFCMNVGDLRPEIALPCGMPMRLKLCDASVLGADHWIPGTFLDDSTLLTPLASPKKDITYYLVNAMDSVLDSLRIVQESIDLGGEKQSFSLSCGSGMVLNGPTYRNAIYSYAPTTYLSYFGTNPFATPPRTMQYIRTVQVPGCGSFNDTFFIEIERTPLAVGFASDTLKSVDFFGFVRCADSLRWDFGDGNSSDQLEATHTYSNWGTYEAVLSVFTDSLVDRDTVAIVLVSSIRELGGPEGFALYPNPSRSGIFNVVHTSSLQITEINIWSMNGTRIAQQPSWNGNSISLDVPKGMYLLRIESEEELPFYYKVVKQ